MKNFLITYKFPCINNSSFVLEPVGKCINFTKTQMMLRNMNSFKRNNFKHFSSSVCHRANHCNNGQTGPPGHINFAIELDIKEGFDKVKPIEGVPLPLFYTLRDLLKDHDNTKFKSIFFLCNKPSAPISMYDTFHQEDFNFTCNVLGLAELVLVIVDTIDKKKPDIALDKIYLVISL